MSFELPTQTFPEFHDPQQGWEEELIFQGASKSWKKRVGGILMEEQSRGSGRAGSTQLKNRTWRCCWMEFPHGLGILFSSQFGISGKNHCKSHLSLDPIPENVLRAVKCCGFGQSIEEKRGKTRKSFCSRKSGERQHETKLLFGKKIRDSLFPRGKKE